MYTRVCVHVCLFVHVMSPSKTMIMLSNIDVIGTISSFLDYWLIAVVLGSEDESFGDWKLRPFSLYLQRESRASWGTGCPEQGTSGPLFSSGNLSFLFSYKTWLDGPNSSTSDLRIPHIKEILSKSTRNWVVESKHPVSYWEYIFPYNISTVIYLKKRLIRLMEYYLFTYLFSKLDLF